MTTTLAPVVKERSLTCSPEHAFEVFTDGIGRWWPTDTHAIGDDVVDVVLEPGIDGSIHEVHADGNTVVWGRVLAWDPPHGLRFSWHLRRDSGTEVEVNFTPTETGCVLRLVHRQWEAWGDEASEIRGNYDVGWELVLDAYEATAT